MAEQSKQQRDFQPGGRLRLAALGCAAVGLLSACTEPVDCAAEPTRCVPAEPRAPLKLPTQLESGRAAADSPQFDGRRAREALLQMGRRDGLRPADAQGEARLRNGAAKAAAALAKPTAAAPAVAPEALARVGALPSDTMAARRRPDERALAAARLPGAQPAAVPTGAVAAATEDARVTDLKRFFRGTLPVLQRHDFASLRPILSDAYIQRLGELGLTDNPRLWAQIDRYIAVLGALPPSGEGLKLTVQPRPDSTDLQVLIETQPGQPPLRPIVVRDKSSWKLNRF